MQTKLTNIGNSRGVIIPAGILRECQLDNSVSLTVQDGAVVISKPVELRQGWAEAFAKADIPDTEMLIPDTLPNRFDDEEWTW